MIKNNVVQTAGLFFKLILLSAFLGCASVSPKNDTSQLKYTYVSLKLLDLDEMAQLMNEREREFKNTDDTNALKEAVQICLSRPDEDGVVEKIISTVRTPLEDRELWESTLEEILDLAIATIRDENAASVDQVTFSVVIENMISELRPEFLKQYKSPGFETKIIEKIAAADIQLSPPARVERKLNTMKPSFNPSAVAQKMLDNRKEAKKKEVLRNREEKIDSP